MTKVIGIGNAIVDVIARAEDTFLEHMGIEKGIMQLIDRPRAELLYAAMENRVETPGGSVANTIAGLGKLGLEAAFIGKVKADALGRGYAEGMQADGIAFPNPPVEGADAPTSRSMIFVSPDGERSMNTYLGAGADLGAGDVAEAAFSDGGFVFLEGYLFDKDEGKTAFRRAAQLMHDAGGQAGITLSDPFCTDRHRADFQQLIAGEMDVTIGNEAEWTTLYETDLDTALDKAASACRTVVCTRSGDAVLVIQDGKRVEIPVETVVPVDATGAGDQFAAGFLYGYTTGRDMETSGRMGVAAAAEVIGHVGPRPETDMGVRFKELGLL
ncbi:5-dehydro-2-deoxygluconokinase [Rhodobacteraceae bacterium THAF1]|uniref:adenosine kinase n=1 Tax=Palleronia sp. THAF1 TaxID=2587842 RepID=UPI000F3E8572|nr:adenosine kinase [Palleronia sp. THAF1]QFU07825.1 5-dehydro-2-deoxygluconokinase [Palleronia sp. THAF1]VDC25641.1 5-dehydro-2-deoxygluconokinase [Rhodobacteraceae bacterium THAF1]